MKMRRMLAIMMAVLMLLGMLPTTLAETESCDHDWARRWLQGEPANCQDFKPIQEYCTKCGETGWTGEYCGKCKPGSVQWPNGKPKDCNEYGSWEINCVVCGEWQDGGEERGPHNWKDNTLENPTCTENGLKETICSICGDEKDSPTEVPSLGHDWGAWETVAEGTCNQVGARKHKCKRCNDVQFEDTGYGDHKWGAWRVVLEPTCTEKGRKERVCTNTGDHGKCGAKESLDIDPIGHEYGDWITEQKATCIQESITKRVCSRCGHTEYMDSDYGPHSWGAWILIDKGDCTHPGKEERTCSLCGETESRTTEEGSHDWGNWDVTKEATCTEDGSEERKCSLCGKTETKTHAALGHDWSEWVVIQEPDPYGQVGIRERKCHRCGLTEREEFYMDGTHKKGDNDSEEIEEIQEELNENGYDCGKPDGDFGNNTEKAWKEWQEDHGYTPDGIMWPGQVDELLGNDDENNGDDFQYVTVEKSIVSTPANGEYYQQGETISFLIKVVIPEGKTITDLEITDPLKGNNEDATLDILPTATSADNLEYIFDYVVTADDVNSGYVENSACAYFFDPVGDAWVEVWSNTVGAPTGGKKFIVYEYVTIGDITVSKSVISTPANGQFYMPGETVTFQIDVTNTHETMAMLDVVVTDPLMTEYGGTWECMSIDPGMTESFTFNYVVTPIDATAGSIYNIAAATGYVATGDPTNPKGIKRMGVSNTVVVLTGFEGDFPFGVITDLEIVKEETSTPANGTYYTEGETINYQITYTNTGETKLGEVIIYDSLATGDIAYAEMLDVGESRYCTFSYVVTAEDVAMGYVVNTAMAQYDYNGYFNTAISEPVVSDTDGDENTTYVPGPGKIDWEKLHGTGTEGEALDTCYLKPIVRDGVVIEYEAHFCTEHAATHNEILTMAQSTDDANMQMVWEYAYAMWQQDIDAMYEEILAVCDEDAKITVMSERVTYLPMIANTQFALKIAEPGQPAETAKVISDLWQYKCIDLCYLMNTAPAERVDSIFSIELTERDAAADETCTCVVSEETENKIQFADNYCVVHSFTYITTELLLMADTSEETWATVRSLWEIELNTVYNTLYLDASEEGGIAYLVEYSAYLSWLKAQEEFLNAAYPENPEIVDEAMVNIIIDRVQACCERMK